MSTKEKLPRKVSLESLKNSEQYIKDAKILAKKRSYGHAFALAVFAEEELAKAVMYHLCTEGIFGINGKWRKDSLRHDKKQIFASWLAFLYELSLMAEEAAGFAQRKGKKEPQKIKQLYESKMDELIRREQRAFDREKGDVYKHLKPFEKLQKRREEAMYVGINLKDRKVTSPSDFKKSETREYISDVEERIEVLKDEITRKMKPQEKQAAITNIKERLERCTNEERRKLLEWYGLVRFGEMDRMYRKLKQGSNEL